MSPPTAVDADATPARPIGEARDRARRNCACRLPQQGGGQRTRGERLVRLTRHRRDAQPPHRRTDAHKNNTQVVRGAALTALVFAATLFGGARAFGSNALPNVLNNYEADSLGATVARLGTGVAILSGFPLMFAGLKAALDGCFKLRGPARPATHGALLAAIASVAATSSEDDIGLIIELLGSTLGVAAAYVVPGLCAARSSALEKKHRRSGALIAVGGMGLCVGGTYLTLKTHA